MRNADSVIAMHRPVVRREERRAVDAVLRSGQLASGAWVRRFEERFARYVGARHGIAASSGTAALHAALLSLGVRPGDRVVTTPFTFIASVNAIVFCGATPVFCDVEEESLGLDPSLLARELRRRKARAVLPVHLYGHPCRIREIVALSHRYGAAVLEDCAQAHGAADRGRRVGSFGDAAAFSFYATKNLMTGEGGMVVTGDADLARRARKLMDHGRRLHYDHDQVGYNFRMTNVAAALGLAQLSRLGRMNRRRREIARAYDRALRDVPWIEIPRVRRGATHVYHLYTVRTRRRDDLAAHLRSRGIGSAVVYPTTIPEQSAYRKMGYDPAACPVARRISREVLSLPVHPSLAARDVARVIAAVRALPER